MEKTICANRECLTKFKPKPYWQRFCSPKCRDRIHYLEKKEAKQKKAA